MRLGHLQLLALAACVACGGPDAAPPDAPSPGPDARCMEVPSCTCGNSVVEDCWVSLMPGHCPTVPMPEPCDTTTDKTCEELGYYGGALACTACKLDTSACEVCPPQTSCTAVAKLVIERGVWASGTRVAVAAYNQVAIFDGLTEVARTAIAEVHAIAPTTNGWLVVSGDPATLRTLATNGQLGTAYALWPDTRASKIAQAANGRIVFVTKGPANPNTGDDHLFATITDATGNVVVPAMDLMTIFGQDFAVATDGTSFFVGGDGMLIRIATDGTRTAGITTQATGSPQRITWSGSSGWYVAGSVGQRFDAAGALVGSSVSLPLGGTVHDVIADGTDLLALLSSTKVVVKRIDATGTPGAAYEVGAGNPFHAGLVRVGSSVFVTWEGATKLQVALVTP